MKLHTPVPCRESVAPTAYRAPSNAVLMDQKILTQGQLHSNDAYAERREPHHEPSTAHSDCDTSKHGASRGKCTYVLKMTFFFFFLICQLPGAAFFRTTQTDAVWRGAENLPLPAGMFTGGER